MTRLRRVSIRRNRELRAGKRVHVQIEYLVIQLDIISRCLPGKAIGSPSRADLILPRILSLEGNKSGDRETVELQQQRRLEASAGVRENLASACGQVVQQPDFGCNGAECPAVGLVAVREERVLYLSRGVVHPHAYHR